jgi:hypothetical protein
MDDFAKGLLGDVSKVTKKWADQNKREIREAGARAARQSHFRQRRTTVQEAAWDVMVDAYTKASGGGRLPVKPRQIMYAARGHIQQITGKRLDDRYFCQTILPDYCLTFADETASWDIVWDARGNLVEPHTNRQVPLGTLEVREYQAGSGSRYLVREHQGGWATCGPDDRFGAVLFVEKEGFMPLFRAVKLAERYDLAIMSTKGLSTTSARQLVDHFVGGKGVPVLCIRDFDLDGFKIAGTLREGTRRYSGSSEGATELGLRGEDVETWGLEGEDVFYRGAGGRLLEDPAAIRGKIEPTLRGYGATADEIDLLLEQRVELNAFASDKLFEWIEGKLEEHGVEKIVPRSDVLTRAARGFARDAIAERHLKALEREIDAEVDKLDLDGLRDGVVAELQDHSDQPWDGALKELVLRRLAAVADGGLMRTASPDGTDSSRPRSGERRDDRP